VDVSVAHLPGFDLRDLYVEDNVRKRPFSNKISTRHPFGPFESAAKLQLFRETSKSFCRKKFWMQEKSITSSLRSEWSGTQAGEGEMQPREGTLAATRGITNLLIGAHQTSSRSAPIH
jgi:hypothetical protein